jgi:hypothetical protein
MGPANGTPYQVSRMPAVTTQIRELWERAVLRGFEREFRRWLLRAVARLQTNPLLWGDPEYHPKKEGSVVRHGILGSLYLQYAVYEVERVVIILRVSPVPSSILDS